MNYNNICLEDSCETPVSSGEYGSYCPSHRLDANGCCRNHCLIDEEGGHCIHCTPNGSPIHCGFCRCVTIDFEGLVCAICTEDNGESPYITIRGILQDIVSIARYSHRRQLVEDFKELIDCFTIGYSPVLWAEKLLSAIMGSVFLNREENTIATNIDKFIQIVVETLLESGTAKEDIINKIEVTHIGEIKAELHKLIETIFEYDSGNDADYFDSEDDVEDFHNSYQILAPTREEQTERLSILNIRLCEECMMPCKYIWCKDCWF